MNGIFIVCTSTKYTKTMIKAGIKGWDCGYKLNRSFFFQDAEDESSQLRAFAEMLTGIIPPSLVYLATQTFHCR